MLKNKLLLFLCLSAVIAIGFTIFFLTKSHERSNKPAFKTTVLSWELLSFYDDTEHIPHQIQALDKEYAKIPGYMIPLEDHLKKVQEFIFLPAKLTCIHDNLPFSNQIIFVKMAPGRKINVTKDAVWLYGRFYVQKTSRKEFGNSFYKIIGEKIEIFDDSEE